MEAGFIFNLWILTSTYSIWNRVQKVFAGESMAVKIWIIFITIFKYFIIAIIFIFLAWRKQTINGQKAAKKDGYFL